MLLENKSAVIYGTGGIGRAVAWAFVREGAKVFLAGRTFANVEAVAREISAAGGVVEAAQVDALDEQTVEAHIGDVAEKAGRIDILFNAIGMQDVQGKPLYEMPLDDVIRPVTIATRTHFLTARAAARRMIGQGSGVIMTITAVPDPAPNVGGFDVACAAVEALWRSFAAELGSRGIRFGIVRSPGSPDTPAVQEMFELHARAAGKSLKEYLAGFNDDALLGQMPMVAEVANAATRMAADLSQVGAKSASVAIVICGPIVEQRSS